MYLACRNRKWQMSKISNESKRYPIGIKISKRILKKLQKHIAVSNYALHQDLSQQEWILKAITEKLEREKANSEHHFNSLKQVTIRLDRSLKDQIEKKLFNLKASNDQSKSYSKKSWILEAIEEKLDREEK